MLQSGFNINDLVQQAQIRWLKPAEVLFILKNCEDHQLTQEAPQKPTSGSLFLFNKRVLRFFRKDGHSWRKKKDGRTVGEAHERLKVGNVEALNCYYAHGANNPNFQRRSYWMLDPAYEHIVLVHYREISEVRHTSGIIQLSPGSSSTFSRSPDSCVARNPGSISVVTELYGSNQNLSSPGSVEVSSEIFIKDNGLDHMDKINGTGEFNSSSELEVSQALRRLEEQLSLNDESWEEIGPFCSQNGNSNDYGVLAYEREVAKHDDHLQGREEHGQLYGGHCEREDGSNNSMLLQNAGDNGIQHHQSFGHVDHFERKELVSWKDMLELHKKSSNVDSKEKHPYTSDTNEKPSSFLKIGLSEEQKNCHWLNFGENNSDNYSMLPSLEVENLKFPSLINTHETNPDNYMMFFNDISEIPFEENSSLTISQTQKFTIHEISPEWGYSSEATKVIIIGTFLCDSSECVWTCMIGDIEVPLEIIQEGIFRCHAPPHLPGKVSLCITSGNRESCSEVREFEFRSKPTSCTHSNFPQTEAAKSPEEQLLLVRFVQMLLSDPLMQKGANVESRIDLLRKLKVDEDSWSHVIEALLVGSGTSTSTMDWLLQELLKDKLLQWLSSRSQQRNDHLGCSLSKKEQGILHMVAGMGFEWALKPILSYGVNINFRDINGWTALHWAARFGREKMVAALIASGASAGAVTDPNSLDPTGRTPASIAAASGHKGLAGYLSEVELTSHLSSLTLGESELSKGSADVEAEMTVNSISKGSLTTSEDQLSLKDTLAAVRNATQAAARIQSAFRAHSFRKRQQMEASTAVVNLDEYVITSNDIQGISAASKLAFRKLRDHNTAALSIQKKYRGWKGRKDFLELRQKVVKIQAHVRGHQVRKNYRVICWAVGILEKVVLRWRRKGVGLRGFRPEPELMSEGEDEDILKVFRKEKVEVAVDQAVSRVLSMVDSPKARQQYHRMLEKYRQAKAELSSTDLEAESMARTSM
ncbi:calmodulin-binding transcription activator 4 isoform X2 [Malania oleifera]|uniref:calmodulin-binding transcription activator 4 isoform X2 n=1 Tax=Malania oleifera TaxID=397392 RepID=UPI0025AE766C|nr:calmodulin-binding transcription activator 4 isoform X2 [Malania oleifera]